jgi:large subunit ribosomal protein L10
MEHPRPQKVAVVEAVRERLATATAVFVTEYRGLKVSELESLRRELATVGAEFKVAKNTLVRIAARATEREGLEPLLEGPTGLVFAGADVAAAAKRVRDFARANPALVIKGGLLEASFIDAAAIARLADLPPREVLLAQLAGALTAPMANFAGVLIALPRNLAYGLKALADQRAA